MSFYFLLIIKDQRGHPLLFNTQYKKFVGFIHIRHNRQPRIKGGKKKNSIMYCTAISVSVIYIYISKRQTCVRSINSPASEYYPTINYMRLQRNYPKGLVSA